MFRDYGLGSRAQCVGSIQKPSSAGACSNGVLEIFKVSDAWSCRESVASAWEEDGECSGFTPLCALPLLHFSSQAREFRLSELSPQAQALQYMIVSAPCFLLAKG